ncbi:MAG: hypothetical protein VKJ02_17950 [Snowella sp.]|nr:hypothetical protein [Snowella sp.]
MAQKLQRSSKKNSQRSRRSVVTIPFISALVLTVLVYLLRGFAVLTFLPGGILLGLMGLTLLLGVFYGIDKTRRF